MKPLLLRALLGEETERRPLWIMRQAGRFLPEYRALKEKHSFEELCADPALACEVTMMPLRRFELDAAITFADLVSPAAALGLDFRFDPGPVLATPVRDLPAIRRLKVPSGEEIAPEVAAAQRLIKPQLKPGQALLGFAGAPLSMAAYVVEGSGKQGFPGLRALLAEHPIAFGDLLSKLARLSARYLIEQHKAGCDAVQVFDSWGGLLSVRDWRRAVRPHLLDLLTELRRAEVPTILYANDAPHLVPELALLPADAMGLCWRNDLPALREELGPHEAPAAQGGTRALQGNLDPAILLAGPEATAHAARDFLGRMPRRGHIMNLGHGIQPQTPIESVAALIETVREEASRRERPAPIRPIDRARTMELLARYDQPGPRYTSYPTAVEFSDALKREDYERKLEEANARKDEPLSVYVHLPFCEERCLFCGCHVIISPDKAKAKPYQELLEAEIEMVARRLPERRIVSQLHLGGGTPTYQDAPALDRLLRFFFERFQRTEDAELAVEVDPRVTTEAHLDVLAAHGFNRISLGVQDFNPTVQEAIHRVQSVEQTRHIVEAARARGFRGVNIDLIYGLPHQTVDGFERTVDTVIEMEADRSAVYSFAFVPWIRGHQRKMMEDNLPEPSTKIELFALARELFLRAGYESIGMDHFARKDDELARAKASGKLRRNFQGYAVVPADDVIGLGISAIGDLGGAYVQNQKKMSSYAEDIEAGRLPVERGLLLTEDDLVRRFVIHRFMCNFRIDVREVEERYGIDFAATFPEDLRRLREHEATGLVTITPDEIRATEEGELFIRNLSMCFDRYWRERHEGKQGRVFSRTV